MCVDEKEETSQNKLGLLLTEYEAGNTSSRNEIMVNLDELRNGKGIGEEEYIEYNYRLNKDNVKDIIDSTSEVLIREDKKELLELLELYCTFLLFDLGSIDVNSSRKSTKRVNTNQVKY